MPIHLVLMPGMDGTGILFRPLLRVLNLDVSASVLAYPCDEPLGYEALVSRVMPALPRDRPFVLVAESFSGPLALQVATLRPPNLVAVILCATFVTNPLPWVPVWSSVLICPALFAVFPASVLTHVLLGRCTSAELRALFGEVQALVRPAVLASRARAILTVNVEQELRECPYPMLYIRGRDDYVVSARNLQRIQQGKPDIQVTTIAAPHLVLQAAPALALEAIRDFCTTVGAI